MIKKDRKCLTFLELIFWEKGGIVKQYIHKQHSSKYSEENTARVGLGGADTTLARYIWRRLFQDVAFQLRGKSWSNNDLVKPITKFSESIYST